MTLIEKIYYITCLKCKHGAFASRLAKNLALCKNTLGMKKANLQAVILTNILDRYQCFANKVYNAQIITFTRSVDGVLTVTFTLDAITYTYTGTGSQQEIAEYFAAAINNYHGKYLTYINENCLYIYSYYSLEDFTIVPTINITNTTGSISITTTSLEGNLNVLLDSWNCITSDDFCRIKKKITNLISC